MPRLPATGPPVLVLSDHVAMRLRLSAALEPFAPVCLVSSELDLLARLQEPVRLIAIHGVAPFADPRMVTRVRHGARDPQVPIVVLAPSREPAWANARELIASGQVEDVIRTDSERVDALVAAWSLHRDRCRRKVEALRLAHRSTPESLHGFLEELLLDDRASLSVSAWVARKPDGSRFALRRVLAREGVSPSTLVEVARVLNVVSRMLIGTRPCFTGRLSTLPEVRATRRLLARTLGLSPSDVSQLARDEVGAEAVRARAERAIGAMLRASRGNEEAAS